MIPERTNPAGHGIAATICAVILAVCLCGCGSDTGDRPPAGPAGAIDTAFGEGGIRRLSYPASADDVRIDSQGRVLLASHYTPLNEALFTRVFPDGGFDPSLFRRMPDSLGMASTSSVFPLADGGFIGVLDVGSPVPGPAGVARAVASRFDANGVLDTAYGSAGTAFVQTRTVLGMIGATDGSVVILGMRTPLESPTGAAEVVRLDPAGQRVPDYGRRVESAVESTLAACGGSGIYDYRGAVQPDGRLVLVIHQLLPVITSLPARLCTARLNADGSPDTDFGNGGSLLLPPPPNLVEWWWLGQVLVRPDGKIVVVLTFRSRDTFSALGTAVLWLTQDGRVDAGAGAAGVTLIDGSLLGEAVHASAQADGKLLLVGYPRQPFAGGPYLLPDRTRPRIVRLDVDGRTDLAFGPSGNGIVTLEAGGNRLLPTRIVTTDVGTAYVAGGAVPVGPVNDLAYLSLSVTKIFTGER